MTDGAALANLVMALAGTLAFAVAVLWQPTHECRWDQCPHKRAALLRDRDRRDDF